MAPSIGGSQYIKISSILTKLRENVKINCVPESIIQDSF